MHFTKGRPKEIPSLHGIDNWRKQKSAHKWEKYTGTLGPMDTCEWKRKKASTRIRLKSAVKLFDMGSVSFRFVYNILSASTFLYSLFSFFYFFCFLPIFSVRCVFGSPPNQLRYDCFQALLSNKFLSQDIECYGWKHGWHHLESIINGIHHGSSSGKETQRAHTAVKWRNSFWSKKKLDFVFEIAGRPISTNKKQHHFHIHEEYSAP